MSQLTAFHLDSALSYLLAFSLPLLDAVLPLVPSETALIALGVATAGSTDPRITLLVGLAALGAFLGDNLSYLIGSRFQPAIERRFFSSQKGRNRRAWAEQALERFGARLILVCRFFPGGRTAVTLTCGIVSYPRKRFVAATALSAAVWAAYAFFVGRLGGSAFEDRPWIGFLLALGSALAITGLVEAARRTQAWGLKRRSRQNRWSPRGARSTPRHPEAAGPHRLSSPSQLAGCTFMEKSEWHTLARSQRRLRRLNIGCGHDKREGYLNVDTDPFCNPDLVVDNDLSSLPLQHYEEILARDILEHIPRPHTLAALLDWSSLLKPAGTLTLQTSSVLGVAKQLELHSKFADQHGWLTCLFGNQAHNGDYHHNGFTEVSLRTYLLAAGFAIDSLEVHDRWLFKVTAHVAYDWMSVLRATSKKTDDDFVLAIFRDAFGRHPDQIGQMHVSEALRNGDKRMALLKHLYSSPERLYYTAQQNGL